MDNIKEYLNKHIRVRYCNTIPSGTLHGECIEVNDTYIKVKMYEDEKVIPVKIAYIKSIREIKPKLLKTPAKIIDKPIV